MWSGAGAVRSGVKRRVNCNTGLSRRTRTASPTYSWNKRETNPAVNLRTAKGKTCSARKENNINMCWMEFIACCVFMCVCVCGGGGDFYVFQRGLGDFEFFYQTC